MSKQFDVIVIGGGPGGYIAAIRAAQLGFNVACVDEWKNAAGGPALGGTCTNVGCIPSKALLQSSEHFEHAGKHFVDHGINVKGLELDLGKMLARKDQVVKQNNDGVAYLFKKNKITFFHGRASFVKAADGGYELKVAGAAEESIVGKHIIVATGSNARALPGAPFDEENILSNDGALRVGAVPKKLALIGSGVIGLEMGSVWRRLGADRRRRGRELRDRRRCHRHSIGVAGRSRTQERTHTRDRGNDRVAALRAGEPRCVVDRPPIGQRSLAARPG